MKLTLKDLYYGLVPPTFFILGYVAYDMVYYLGALCGGSG